MTDTPDTPDTDSTPAPTPIPPHIGISSGDHSGRTLYRLITACPSGWLTTTDIRDLATKPLPDGSPAPYPGNPPSHSQILKAGRRLEKLGVVRIGALIRSAPGRPPTVYVDAQRFPTQTHIGPVRVHSPLALETTTKVLPPPDFLVESARQTLDNTLGLLEARVEALRTHTRDQYTYTMARLSEFQDSIGALRDLLGDAFTALDDASQEVPITEPPKARKPRPAHPAPTPEANTGPARPRPTPPGQPTPPKPPTPRDDDPGPIDPDDPFLQVLDADAPRPGPPPELLARTAHTAHTETLPLEEPEPEPEPPTPETDTSTDDTDNTVDTTPASTDMM